VLKNLELNAALRYDRYTQVGGTTNPKLGFKFTPTPELLMRGSYNTGFRAPTPQQLNLGTVQLATTGSFADPVKCPVPAGNNDPSCQLNSIPYLSGGNPNLKPEKSRQASLGVVIAPTKGVQASFDFWQIKMIDRIHNLTPTQELVNYSVFANNFQRDANGNITLIQAGWINAGGSMTRGLDIVGNWTLPLEGATLSNTVSATKMISAREQLIDGTPMVQYVGQWTNTTLYLPWKVNFGSTYKAATWSATASLNYSSRYMDEDHTTLTSLPGMQKRKISAYTTVNLVGSYTGIKDLGVSVGVLNVMNRKPPFTWHDVDNAVGTGWDPRVVDPRGRTVQVTANYKFW
jgi:iron complex outermembrane receptor protein